MFRNRLSPIVIAMALLFTVLIAYAASASPAAQSDEEMMVLEFDIAENGTRFIVDETPQLDDGQPASGAEFITQGYLYPAGTLNGTNGTLPNGDPEFPDLVLGTWVCRGWFMGDGAHTTAGPVVVTTQIFDLGDAPGSTMIITDGFELADLNMPFSRAIIGGTGEYANAGGVQIQEALGYDEEPFGINLRVTLQVMTRAGS